MLYVSRTFRGIAGGLKEHSREKSSAMIPWYIIYLTSFFSAKLYPFSWSQSNSSARKLWIKIDDARAREREREIKGYVSVASSRVESRLRKCLIGSTVKLCNGDATAVRPWSRSVLTKFIMVHVNTHTQTAWTRSLRICGRSHISPTLPNALWSPSALCRRKNYMLQHTGARRIKWQRK